MEEVNAMVRRPLSGNGLTISSIGICEHQPKTKSNDVLLIQAGSTDSCEGGGRQTSAILTVAPNSSQLPSEATGATVFVAAGSPVVSSANSPTTWRRTTIPEVQSENGYGTKQQQLQSTPLLGQRRLHQPQQQQTQSTHHIVKIRINPEVDTGRVISTVRLTPEQEDPVAGARRASGKLIIENSGTIGDNDDEERFDARREDGPRLSAKKVTVDRASKNDGCVRISVVNGQNEDIIRQKDHNNVETIESPKWQDRSSEEIVQQRCANESVNATSLNRTTACFYYGSSQNQLSSMVMSSGQCSPSDTLDSGTCSDLDGTPPPLPKKKNNSSRVMLGVVSNGNNGGSSGMIGQHNRTGSLTSSGAELDSDDNESSISCDSLNSGELAATIDQQSVQVNGVKSGDCINDEGLGIKGSPVKVDILKVTDNEKRTNADENITEHVDSDHESRNNNNRNINNDNTNNNNNNNKNNNNNHHKHNNNNVDERVMVNGKIAGEAEMNERNNGTVNVDNGLIPEVITNSGRTSPCVSPSPSGASSLSKSSSTPRVRSPVASLSSNGRVGSPMVKECTYEQRMREQDRVDEETAAAAAAADYYANYNRDNGTKYLYDDDRFYEFHINEHRRDDDDNDEVANGTRREKDSDEFFAGYKILDREAIRSAKGTVRGVKNRVRAGIATFLQKPSTKNYKTKDEGKIVVYTTSMSIVRETYFACVKMLQILKTHMVKHEVRDMFMSRELQTELKERIGCENIEVPQLFIDGQYIGNADVVERLNESGELRRMFKPYKCLGASTTCFICGGCRLLPCTVCNGSKKSPVRNDFMKEFYWLRCMNCDEVGLVRCQHC